VERDFLDHCDRGAECVKACPTGVLAVGAGGHPVLRFSGGECTFCGLCVDACPSGALFRDKEGAAPWALVPRISEACVAYKKVECRICAEACDARAIRFQLQAGSVAQPVVEGSQCSGCGACVAPCPTDAITLEMDSADS
jgi:ferredoxin-type protein NapF